MKLLKVLFILCLVAFPFGEILRFDLGNNIAVRLLDLFVILTFFCFVLISIKNRKPVENYLKKPVLIFSFVGLTSLVINLTWLKPNEFFVAILYLVRWVCYANLLFIASGVDKKFKQTVSKVLLVDGLIILILGYVQYFLYPDLRNLYYLGWDEHNYRMFSTFLDPNYLGAFLVLFLLFLISLIKKEKKHLYLLGFVAMLCLVAIFLTYSRGAILMLVVSFGTYLILISRKKYLLGLIGAVVVAIIILMPTFDKENTNLFRTASSMARLETYNNASKIIVDNPIFGVGFNAYRYAQQKYSLRQVYTKYPNHADAGVDNSFLFVFATTGTLGLLAYLNIWKTIIVRFKKSPILISSIVGLFINSFFINSLFFPSIMLWMWVLIGIGEDY